MTPVIGQRALTAGYVHLAWLIPRRSVVLRAVGGPAALAAAYALSAALGLRLAFANDSVTTVWPPTGIAVAALVLWGPRLWPGIAAGAFVANLANGSSAPVALGIAVGNTLAPVLAASLLRRLRFSAAFDRVSDVFVLVCGAGAGAMVVSAAGGVAVLHAAGHVPPGRAAETFLTWWVGDAMGVAVVAPLVMVLASWRTATRRASALEVTAIAGIVGAGTWLVLTLAPSLLFGVPLLAVWAAVRRRHAGAVVATVVVAGLAVLATIDGHTLYGSLSLTQSLIVLQLFNGTIALTSLVIATVLGQRDRAQEAFRSTVGALADLSRELEDKVVERTAALQRSEAFHRLLTENISDVIVRVGLDGVIRYVSPSSRRLAGADPDSYVGGRIGALAGHTDDPALLDAFNRAKDERQPTAWRGPITTADGRTIWIESLFNPSTDPATGEVIEVIEVVRDITDHVRIRNSLEQAYDDLHRRSSIAASIARTARDVACAPDLATAVQMLEATARTFIDAEWMTIAERSDDNTFTVLAHRTPDGWEYPEGVDIDVSSIGRWQWMRDGRAEIIDDTFERTGGFEYMLRTREIRSFIAVPMVAAGEVRAVVAFSSPRPHAFSREVLPILETFVREIAGPFNTLRLLDRERENASQLRVLNELKNDFVGMVAHDLKSPMAAVKGYARLLEVHWHRASDAKKQELVGRIGEGLSRLTDLVDDVLQIAHIESEKICFDIQPFDIAELVSRTVEDMLQAFPGRRCELDIGPDVPDALGDTDQQWRVLTNLLSNAFKFSEATEPVTVGVRREGDEICVEVADRGRGIAAEDMPRLFERFSRIKQSGPKVAGTGLGLYICRSLVEGQGGRIWATSVPGSGSTFSYTAPVAVAVLRTEVARLRASLQGADGVRRVS